MNSTTPDVIQNCDELLEMIADPALLAELSTIPAFAESMRALQEELVDMIDEFSQEAFANLNQLRQKNENFTLAIGMPVSAASLKTGSRQRELDNKGQHDMAEQIVLGAMVNAGNPDWDVLDATTGISPEKSLLAALLKSGLPH